MNYVVESALWIVAGGLVSYRVASEWVRRILNDRST